VIDFEDSLETAVFTTSFVMQEDKPILYVSHDTDGAWQFHAATEGVDTTKAMMVSLKNILDHDETIRGISDLPLGHVASRGSKDDPWVYAKQD